MKIDMREKQRLQAILDSAHTEHEKKLIQYALFKTSNQSTSDDLVQETFMKAWGYLVRGGKVEIMRAFLYHILNDLIVDEYRKRKTTSLDVLLEKGFEPLLDDRERNMNVFDGKRAMLLIEQLPEKYRTIMYMRYEQDLTLEEIALITGKTKNAIAVQSHRGLEKLRVLYHKQ